MLTGSQGEIYVSLVFISGASSTIHNMEFIMNGARFYCPLIDNQRNLKIKAS